ncbi:MAG: Pyruvate dehydrogenase E1 component beta subunit [uncultured Chloroflexi bacterium]|uniref:Pyruvate dehydrogenase E1 component beta subunit n=1 Tax=uncultured Chloroflexota bacterium TaxID=166587 RepID=A0A6J4KBB0_9CHLR|nr:MAG: Pyruvate dehydrogenase E1 component beta subunit [uncultured Chloroflexota bacterium]
MTATPVTAAPPTASPSRPESPPSPRRRGDVGEVSRLTYVEALVEGIRDEMRRDPDVFFMGQDVGPMGGAMQGARGLFEEFGPRRVKDTPISESAMVGAAVGAALAGKRPIVEVSFGEFLPTAMNQIVLQAANLHYMTAGVARVPLVLRTRVGDGPYRGHPQMYEAWFTHIPGLKVVMPSTPADAKGMMVAAIRDPNPVLFFEHMWLYHGVRGDVPGGDYTTPLHSTFLRRHGQHATVAATGWMVHKALTAATQLAQEGIEVEVVDLACLAPLETTLLEESVRKTSRLVVAHEAWRTSGFGAEIAATLAERCFFDLDAPVARVAAPDAPLPLSKPLRDAFLPDVADIVAAIRAVLAA